MYKFRIAGEGVTDQVVIENILCGYFENQDLDGEIKYSHPLFDETDQKQKGFGNWTMLLEYLDHSDFRADTLNCECIVIQVDTDVSNEKGFDVVQVDDQNRPLSSEALISNVIAKLRDTIETGEKGFYDEHAEKIIFAVSVHSIECWLYAHYNKKWLKSPKITGCEKALLHLYEKGANQSLSKIKPNIDKNYVSYNKLSEPFLKRRHIDEVVQKDPSFRVFIGELAKIESQV
ncbi:MAG: hypothetical protein PHR16_05360 [Methylovulum sp.]|nr:hypothetical protein [Methylovulum sp.]